MVRFNAWTLKKTGLMKRIVAETCPRAVLRMDTWARRHTALFTMLYGTFGVSIKKSGRHEKQTVFGAHGLTAERLLNN